MLILNTQLCLAHYCDVHGPTPLMVTEGLPVPCTTCYEDDRPAYSITSASGGRPRAATPTAASHAVNSVNESLRRLSVSQTQRSSSVPASEHEALNQRATLLKSAPGQGLPPAIETPPQSPRFSSEHSQQKPRRESGFRRTYDDYVTRRAGPCDNLSLIHI